MYALNKGLVQISNSIKKIGQDMTVNRERNANITWKMLNLTPDKRNANYNHIRYDFFTYQNDRC